MTNKIKCGIIENVKMMVLRSSESTLQGYRTCW
uniref:Uncharacterized protein n=1 Tax=Siphoviridae sp. ctKcB20 TaxID=2827568 RepID=A0A8S5LL87_9CAUD|nr:MAG TPA: hypothetical protein [Siphoviridae sp. ctKcB20]